MSKRIRLDLVRRLVRAAGLGLLLALLLVALPVCLGAPEQAWSASLSGPVTPPGDPPADGDELAQTRWISIDGRQPISFQEWRAAQPPPAPLRVERVYASPARSADAASAPLVCALVNPLLYDGIAASLARWAADVEREGWSALIYSASFPDPPALRAHLASIPGLTGCLVIGDFPIPWFDWAAKQYPFDVYYMDLDGVWHDEDGDGLYENQTGDIMPEIWIGRMTAGNLTFGRDEAGLVNNYFDKNHAYRTGALPLPARALVYVDDDWSAKAASFGASVALLYPDTTVVSEVETTRADDYGRRLTDSYAWIHLFAHSTAGYHVFEFSSQDPTYSHVLYNKDLYDIDPYALFYNLFACGAARFIEPDYLAGWYVFADTYGLAAWGTTTSGSMVRGFSDFYSPLAQGKPLGAAYMDWFGKWGFADRAWHYGLIMLGDPTLIVDDTGPPGGAPAALTLAGPGPDGSSGYASVGLDYTLTATVEPPTATLPFQYTWHVTDKVPLARTGGLQDARSLAWTSPGIKTVAVTAANYAGTVTATRAVTVHAPDLGLVPRALSETLVLGTELTRSLTLSNAGPGDLSFRLLETDHILGAGAGPDPFGYTTLDSNQPGGPLYRWIEIAPPAGGSGAQVPLTGAYADYVFPVPLPFRFNYYGTDYDELAVHMDGILSWSDQSVGGSNLPIPSVSENGVETLIAPFWDSLSLLSGAVYVQDIGSAFVIEYYQVTRYNSSDPGTWEIVLHEDGNILFQYQDVNLWGTEGDNGQSATVGIQGDALTGLQYSYNAPALSAGLAICFAYPGQLPDCSTPVDAPWLSVSPTEGTVTAAGERSVDLVFDASAPGMTQPGLYHVALVALTNDLEQSLVSVPVTMTVLAPTYGLALSPLADARSGRPGETVSYTLHLANTGDTWDAFDLAVDGAAWPTTAPATVGPLDRDDSADLDVTVAIPPDAVHGATDTATLRVTSQGDSSRWVTVTLATTAEVPPPPRYDVFMPLIVRSPGG